MLVIIQILIGVQDQLGVLFENLFKLGICRVLQGLS